MRKNILLFAGIILGILIIALIISRLVLANKPQALSNAISSPNIEKASGEEGELFALAAKYEGSGDLLSLRDTYQKIMEKFPNSNNIQKAQEGLESANVRILFSPIPTSGSISYEVVKGDTLARIAKKFSNTQDMIMRVNNLKSPGVVSLGRRIKVHNEKFSIVVDKSQNILSLKSADKIVKTYRVSTGVNNSTPVGAFRIINKVIDPPWYTAGTVIPPGSPKNILGSRWLGISAKGYGIHGTTDPQSIGKQVTSGCIRMKNPEAEELYSIVPEGTEVMIVD